MKTINFSAGSSQITIYWFIVITTYCQFRRNQRYAHWYDRMYHNIYIPSYANFGSFLFGMIGGYLYCLHKQGHIDLVRSKVSWTMPLTHESMKTITITISGFAYFVVVHDTNGFQFTDVWLLILCVRLREAIVLDCDLFRIRKEYVGPARCNDHNWYCIEYWM